MRVVQFLVADSVVRINAGSRARLLDEAARRLRDSEGFAIATLNLDHLVKLREDQAFRGAYAAHDIVTADGNPIVWLSELARRPVELLPGADLILPLSRLAAEAGVSVALVGTTEASLAGAADRLVAEVPGLRVALKVSPPMGFDADGPGALAVLRRVEASGARLCFVALGAPKQERFAALGRGLLPQVGFACIGAGLDFLSGNKARAPVWVRRLAFEWLWRLATEPRRLGWRYLQSALILPELAIQAWRSRP